MRRTEQPIITVTGASGSNSPDRRPLLPLFRSRTDSTISYTCPGKTSVTWHLSGGRPLLPLFWSRTDSTISYTCPDARFSSVKTVIKSESWKLQRWPTIQRTESLFITLRIKNFPAKAKRLVKSIPIVELYIIHNSSNISFIYCIVPWWIPGTQGLCSLNCVMLCTPLPPPPSRIR
jgi:hypothetical protein